jgi:hypothetical protein
LDRIVFSVAGGRFAGYPPLPSVRVSRSNGEAWWLISGAAARLLALSATGLVLRIICEKNRHTRFPGAVKRDYLIRLALVWYRIDTK